MATKAASNGNGLRQIKMIPVEHLKFDPENPRLPNALKGKGEQELIKWMVREIGITELMGSIGEHGFFPGEPLLVVGVGHKGDYHVVEGNRRLCAVKLLLKPSLSPIRQHAISEASKGAKNPKSFRSLPAVIYDDRDQILSYLGYRHVTGIKEWDTLAKARYLKQLSKSFGRKPHDQQLRELAKGIGSTTNYVLKLLTGLALYERIADRDFLDIEGLSEETISFSLLTTALSWTNITDYLGLSRLDPTLKGLKDAHLKDLAEWLFKKEDGVTKLVESRNLRALNAIVKSPRALEAFKHRGHSIHAAEALAGVPVEVFRKAVHGARKQLEQANETMARVDSLSPGDSEALTEVISLARNIKVVVDEKLAVHAD